MAEPLELKTIADELRQTVNGKYDELARTVAAKNEVIDRIEAEVKTFGDARSETKEFFEKLKHRLDELEAEFRKPSRTEQGPEQKSLADRFIESDGFKQFLDWNKRGMKATGLLKVGTLWPETKTTITTGTVGRSTPGILVPEREPGIVPLARRALRIRDLLPVGTVSGDAKEYVKENVFTNAASPQTEASDKPESALTFTIAHEHTRTIAHWIPATRQVLDDWPELQRYVNETLLYGLKLKEETEILSGDNLGDHLNGLTTQATAYAGTYVAASDTRLDTLAHAILELNVANENPDFIVLNPVDAHYIRLIKTAVGGANTGNYIAADPLGGAITVPTLWGRPVVESNSLTAGKFLMGDSRFCKIFDRQDATVDISTEHYDYFIKNLVAIRCEERLLLAVYRTTAFLYGSF